MKIRNGFVSNSSSSSFLILVEKEDYMKFYNTLSDAEKSVINYVQRGTEKFLDRDIVVISGVEGNYSTFEDYDGDIPEEYEEYGAAELFYDVIDKLKEQASIFEHEVDF